MGAGAGRLPVKVAWVTPYLPGPARSGGAIRQQRLARALASEADVHLFARGEVWEGRRLCSGELGIFATRWIGRDYWPRFSRETGSNRIRRGSPSSLYRAVAELHRKVSLDLVVVSHSWSSLGAPTLGLPWLLDEHNIESRYFAELLRAQGMSGPSVEREIREVARWERQVWGSATALTCVTEADAATIADHRGRGLEGPHLVPNGADVSRLERPPLELRSGGVLFVGSMRHRPNLDAALRLVERILPRVWAELPGLPFTVVGGPIPRRLASSRMQVDPSRRGGVRLCGTVPDLGPYLAEARVYANPVSHGAGSSLKMVEALAAGIPVVSTDVGARGLGLVPGRHYLAANTDEDQARAIARIYRDPELWAALAREGREQVERYDWKRIGDAFVKIARRAAQKASR